MASLGTDLRHAVRRLWEKWRLSPGKASLSRWLILTNIVIVVAVVGIVSMAAIERLRNLANSQALSRVQLAGAVAREEIRRSSEDLLSSARILAERPTLQRLLAERRDDAIAPFLRRFCDTGGFDACAVFRGQEVVAVSGSQLPWSTVVTAAKEQGERFLVVVPGMTMPAQGAVATVSSGATAELNGVGGANELRVAVARLLDKKMERTLSGQAGLDVRLIDYRAYADARTGDTSEVRGAALADGRSAAARVQRLGLYVASLPLYAPTGEVVALIETHLPARVADAGVEQLVRRLLVTSLFVAILGVLAGFVLGRRVTDPLAALNTAAVKLGQGDFSTSIPEGGVLEVVQLARTMETMRRNLIDLTDTLRAREAQARTMLGGISHEFRTPLAAQLGAIELLRGGLGSMPAEQALELVITLERSVLRLMRLIDNLLENVRIEAGQLSIRKERIAISHVIDESCDLVRVLFQQRQQAIDVLLPEEMPFIEGDEQRLVQVFVNLLANANKFAPDGSTVRVVAVSDGAQVAIWVEDEGPDSPEIASEQIFERFNRGGREPRQGGLGLGLWIAKSIVERHGGTISARRTKDNRTRFTVTLPIESFA